MSVEKTINPNYKTSLKKLSSDEKNYLDSVISILEYHRKAMTERRSIAFKAFISLIGLYVISISGALDIIPKISDPILYKWSFTIGCILIFILFVGFLISIEIRSYHDRIKYMNLQDVVINSLIEDFSYSETRYETFKIAWASNWTAAAAIIITIVACLAIWLIQ